MKFKKTFNSFFMEFMKKRVEIIIIILTVIITMFFVVNNNVVKKKSTDSEGVLCIMENELNERLYEVLDINCVNLMRDTFKLSDLVINKRVLIYYYSDMNCSSCYEWQLRMLQKYFSKSVDNVIVLGSYLSYRQFKSFWHYSSYTIPVYYVEHDIHDSLFDNVSVPYCFVLNPDMTTSYFYTPSNEHPETNKLYLERVRTLLSTN